MTAGFIVTRERNSVSRLYKTGGHRPPLQWERLLPERRWNRNRGGDWRQNLFQFFYLQFKLSRCGVVVDKIRSPHRTLLLLSGFPSHPVRSQDVRSRQLGRKSFTSLEIQSKC